MTTGRAAATDEARLSEFFQAVGLDADDDTLAGLLKGLSVNQPQWSLRRVSPQLSFVWPAFRAEADCQALHVAAASGRANSVTSLLRRDAQWGARTRRGVTPLLLAAAGGHAAVKICHTSHAHYVIDPTGPLPCRNIAPTLGQA